MGNPGRGRKGKQRGNTTSTFFKGNTTDMDGNTFQLFSESHDAHQFTKTLKALAVYINKNLKSAGDMTPLYKSLDEPTVQ